MCKQVSSILPDIFSRTQTLQTARSSESYCVYNIEKGSNLGNIKELGILRINQCFTDKSSSTCGFFTKLKDRQHEFQLLLDLPLSSTQMGIQIFYNKVNKFSLKMGIFRSLLNLTREVVKSCLEHSAPVLIQPWNKQPNAEAHLFPNVTYV